MLEKIFKTKSKLIDTNFRTLYFADELYCAVEKLQMRYVLKDQVIRAASSVVLNLAEGNARRTKKDQRRLYNYAYSSAKEVKAVLALAEVQDLKLIDLSDKVCACTFKLCRAL